MKDWLALGGIPADVVDRLSIDLSGRGFHLNNSRKLVIESKEEMRKRKVKSPDDRDALALTFVQVVAPPVAEEEEEEEEFSNSQYSRYGGSGWMR